MFLACFANKKQMKFLYLLLAAFSLHAPLPAQKNALQYDGGKPVKTLRINRDLFLISDQGIYKKNKAALTLVWPITLPVSDAVYWNGLICLASAKGVITFDQASKQAKDTLLPQQKINVLTVDATGKLWIGTSFAGTYTLAHIAQEPVLALNTNGVNALVSTADSTVFLGSNIGLYKINAATMEIIRYAEEGHSGYELPDNIVEQLFPDNHNNVWVAMPDNLSYKSSHASGHSHSETPTFSYVGQQNARIQSIIELDQQQTYLFITNEEVLLLPSKSLKAESHGNHEVFQKVNADAWRVSDKQLGKPASLSSQDIVKAESLGNDIIFYTTKGAWWINKRQIIKNLRKG